MNSMLCPVCGSKTTFKAHAIVAPWITTLIGEKIIRSELYSCLECTLGFFSHRYSETEAQNLYSSYRTGRYFIARHSWEPWYGTAENNAYQPETNQNNIDSRINLMENTFQIAGIKRNFKGCVDFGGDLGQFFPQNVEGTKYLVDLSAQPGVHKNFTVVNSLSEISNPVELVMNCGVLEHMSCLTGIIADLSNALSASGVIYLEVPLDSFKTSRIHKSKFYKHYLSVISRNKPIFVFLDFITGATRQIFRTIPWFGIVKQSEHINYFNKLSLQTLCGNFVGNFWISEPDYSHKQGKFKLGRIAAVLSR
jgi:hypothetical protein